MPLSWTELKKVAERPSFHVADFAEWKQRLKKDPWKDMGTVKQRLKL
jgi:bifunctional non-homologous end joining protein LigD